MTYRVKLTPSAPETVRFLGRNTLRMRIVASDAENMPNEIFLHQRIPVDLSAGETQDEFLAICSPFDLSAYPVGDPADGQSPAFFRKAEIDVLLPGIDTSNAFLAEVVAQVSHLTELLQGLDRLETGQSVWCPSAPDEEDSSSSSSSSSLGG